MERADYYYSSDKNCPLNWEPGGEDFLSPCLEEAALMARILDDQKFESWLEAFLPILSYSESLIPAKVSDRSDPKIVHLDGLNLSRAWNLYIISASLPDGKTKNSLLLKARDHLEASLPYVANEHYEGSHWLGSFAVYALTREQ